MSHELTIRDDNALDVQTLNSDIDALPYGRILPDRTTELEVRTGLDGDDDTYGCYHYSDTEPKADIVADIKSLLPSTATVEYRHTWDEYDDSKDTDAKYYPSHWSDGLRTPPSISGDGTTITASANYLHNDAELSSDLTTDLPIPSEKYGQVHVVVADTDGLRLVSGTEIDNPRKSDDTWAEPDYSGVRVATVAMKTHIDRIPRGGIDVASFR